MTGFENMSILLFRDVSLDESVIKWVAQGIEYDFAASGDTREEALNSLDKTIEHQIILDKKFGKKPLEDSEPLSAHDLMRMFPRWKNP